MARSSQTRRSPQRKRRKSARSSGGGIWSWLLVLLVVGGGIAAYENREQLPHRIAAYLPAAEKHGTSRPASSQVQQTRRTAPKPPNDVPQQATTVAARSASAGVPKPLARPDSITTAAVKPGAPVPPAAVGKGAKDGVHMASLPADKALTGRGHQGRFYFCGTSGLDSCVAAGDTFWYHKTRIALADIEAPATEGAKCQQERDLGFAAKVRLRELLNAGSFELASIGGGAGAGRAERVVSRNGRSLGAVLVAEGLARPRAGRRASWCP